MTFEYFWQWIYFLIWFKLVCGSSSHMWLCSKSWTSSPCAKGLVEKRCKPQETKTQKTTKGRKARVWPGATGRGWLQKHGLKVPCGAGGQRKGALLHTRPAWRCSQGFWVPPWTLGTSLSWHRSFCEVSYLEDRWWNRTGNTLNKIN